MLGTSTKSIGQTSAYLAVAGLLAVALAPLALAAGGATTATTNATLEAFADGSVSKTLAFGAGADSSSNVSLRLPRDAAVAGAWLDASAAASSAVSGGALVFDIGADGTSEATASVSVLSKTRVNLPAAALEAYLRGQANASAWVDVPVLVTGAAASAWSCVLAGVRVEYSTSAQVALAPTFVGRIEAAAVVAGQTNASAIDLGAHFASSTGGDLTFSAQLAADAKAMASGVSLVINGSRVDIRAGNPEFWGEVAVQFAGADAHGQIAVSNEVEVHVVPRPVTVPTLRTEARAGAEAVVALGCGSPALFERFEVPADAVVTDARMTLAAALGVSVLGATVDIVTGLTAVAGVNASDLPREVVLNASAINARLRGQASAFGLVDLDLSADVCPSGSLEGLTAANLSVTYVRGPVNATAPLAPVVATVAVDGEVTAHVSSDASLSFEARAHNDTTALASVEWYIDGKLAGTGATLVGVGLSQGEHTVEARTTAGATVQVFRTTVNATADAAAGAAIAINGLATTTVQSGAALILELRTPRPLAAGAVVEWYVDGKLAGRGQVLADVRLSAGVHTVECKETSSNGTVHTFAAQVTASPAPAPAALMAALLVTGAIVATALGVVAARRRRQG